MTEITEAQRDAINRLIKTIGTIPTSRMEFAAVVVSENPPPHAARESRQVLATELRALGRAHDDLAEAFHFAEIP